MIYLIIFLSLSFSCSEKTLHATEKTVLESTPKSDTLKYTYGIRAVLNDSKGNYWIGGHREGVCVFNGKSFEYFTTDDGLSDNQVRTIQEDENGTIWFGTANGVSSYDGQKITNHTQTASIYAPGEWQKEADDLWFNAGNNVGVYKYNNRMLSYLAFPPLKTVDLNNAYLVTGLSEGKNNMIWFATYAGVIGYNGSSFTVINGETKDVKAQKGLLHVRSVFEDSKGRLWIGNNGVGVLLKEGDSIINFSEKNGLIHPESLRSGSRSPAGTLEHVFAVTEDSKGNIWFGDRDTGAWKYDGKSMTNYTVDKNLKSQMIWHIYEDRKKNLLFSMADGGVYQLKGESFEKLF